MTYFYMSVVFREFLEKSELTSPCMHTDNRSQDKIFLVRQGIFVAILPHGGLHGLSEQHSALQQALWYHTVSTVLSKLFSLVLFPLR